MVLWTRQFPHRVGTCAKGGVGASKVVSSRREELEEEEEGGRWTKEGAESGGRSQPWPRCQLKSGTAQSRSRLPGWEDETTHAIRRLKCGALGESMPAGVRQPAVDLGSATCKLWDVGKGYITPQGLSFLIFKMGIL